MRAGKSATNRYYKHITVSDRDIQSQFIGSAGLTPLLQTTLYASLHILPCIKSSVYSWKYIYRSKSCMWSTECHNTHEKNPHFAFHSFALHKFTTLIKHRGWPQGQLSVIEIHIATAIQSLSFAHCTMFMSACSSTMKVHRLQVSVSICLETEIR